ncbi:unnamed protein product [Camellia sinensis]
MEFDEQVEATVRRIHNVGIPTNQLQEQEEKEEKQTLSGNANNNKKFNRDSVPPGYRFCPSDLELIGDYLMQKVLNQPLPHDDIIETNLYMHNPDYFTERCKPLGEREWYFFTPRDRKYPKGNRPNRVAGDGYWKATGADKPVKLGKIILGYKKSLVFYLGKPPNGDKTDWMMHEFTLNADSRQPKNANDMRLDDWVLCRVYKKPKNSNKVKQLDQSELDNYPVAATLSEEKTPCVNNNNNVAEMNLDYNSMGYSSQFINTCSDLFQLPSLDELKMPDFTDSYACLPELKMPDFTDSYACLPELKMPDFTDSYACLPELKMPDFTDAYACLPDIELPFENELLQTPHTDACFQNFTVPHQPTSLNSSSMSIGSFRPIMPTHIEEESTQQGGSSSELGQSSTQQCRR